MNHFIVIGNTAIITVTIYVRILYCGVFTGVAKRAPFKRLQTDLKLKI